MEYTLEDKLLLIDKEMQKSASKNPIEIAAHLMDQDFISIHGPEHHYLDGAAFLTAYKNAGGAIDLAQALKELKIRTGKMPGAMCGLWGVCGSVSSLGACLAIINGTGPLTENAYYKHNMEFTSGVLAKMARIGGPRCCKRNAFLSITNGVDFVREKYNIQMELPPRLQCRYSDRNQQCIKEKCPFYKK